MLLRTLGSVQPPKSCCLLTLKARLLCKRKDPMALYCIVNKFTMNKLAIVINKNSWKSTFNWLLKPSHPKCFHASSASWKAVGVQKVYSDLIKVSRNQASSNVIVRCNLKLLVRKRSRTLKTSRAFPTVVIHCCLLNHNSLILSQQSRLENEMKRRFNHNQWNNSRLGTYKLNKSLHKLKSRTEKQKGSNIKRVFMS